MNRRDFIGSVIGSLTIAKLLFIAETPKIRQLNDYDQQKILKELWDYPLDYLRQIKLFYVSPYEEIDVLKDETFIWFKSEPLIVSQCLTFTKLGLILPDNYELIRKPFSEHRQIDMISGDTLNGTYTFQKSSSLC